MIEILPKRLCQWLFSISLLLLVSCGNQDTKSVEETIAYKTTKISLNAQDYILELGCYNCHGGSHEPNGVKIKAPDLSYAGIRYKPAFLFNYLLNPFQIRNHIGITRMPDFKFDEREALAVTLYLVNQKEHPTSFKIPVFENEVDISQGKQDFKDLTCVTCHSANQQGTPFVSDLSNIKNKLNPEWVEQFIAAPFAFEGFQSGMPNLLYHLNKDSSNISPSIKNAAFRIKSITSYLMSLETSNDNSGRNSFEAAVKSNSDVTIELGGKIYKSQNCSGCHISNKSGQWKQIIGPDLDNINSRIKKDWLRGYLNNPHAVRPFGFHPGSGSRMPNFNLTDEEIDKIIEVLYADSSKTLNTIPAPSKFSALKAEKMLNEKLSCIGCHSLNNKGGKIGPDLTNIGERLHPDYIERILSKPENTIPGTIMPRTAMPSKSQKELIQYLLYNTDSAHNTGYLSLVDNPIILTYSDSTSRDLYLSKCAVCHGENGSGNGFNASYLETQPTNHSDSIYMSGKTDDTLYDGVHAGGAILNKSHLMPDWGNSLSNDEILSLIKYMRVLCDCNPPKWSTDNMARN